MTGRSTPHRRRPLSPTARRAAWIAFHGHVWTGLLLTALFVSLGVTGILLNHKRALGLMPDVEHTPSAPLEAALPVSELAARGEAAAAERGIEAGVSRMDVRPADGYVKVRLDDPASTEVTLDLATGAVLHVGARNDVFLEKVHSGEIFGDRWVLATDAAAIAMIVLLVSGFWLWIFPRWRRS